MSIKTCYACELPACTVEHCPPKSFFPEGQRDQLLTVPSCAQHNNGNSEDVEYVRGVIPTLRGVNKSGQELLAGKIKRSFVKSPKKLVETFGKMQTVLHESHFVGEFPVDTDRLENVFKACASAIHFHDAQQKQADWLIVTPQLQLTDDVTETDKQKWIYSCEMLRQIGFVQRPTANPRIFEYGVAELEGHHYYNFVFYQSFVVYALSLPEGFQRGSTMSEVELRAEG